MIAYPVEARPARKEMAAPEVQTGKSEGLRGPGRFGNLHLE